MFDGEIRHLFQCLNKSKSGIMHQKEFTSIIKKDIPVSLSKVVDVREIIYDCFERLLLSFTGDRSNLKRRKQRKSTITRPPKYIANIVPVGDRLKVKQLIDRSPKYGHRGKKTVTIKAPKISPFGSNLTEFADSSNVLMHDILTSIAWDDVDSDEHSDCSNASHEITADEFQKYFSKPFVKYFVKSIDIYCICI